MIRSIELKLKYGNTAIVVLNLYTLFFSTVFENNEKTKKKNRILSLDRNRLQNRSIKTLNQPSLNEQPSFHTVN